MIYPLDGVIQRLNNRGLVVMLIVFDRISSFLSTPTGKTHIWKGVAGNLESLVNSQRLTEVR